MKIVLVRHGRPRVESSSISAQDLDRWSDAYNRAGIDPALPPPARTRKLAAGAAFTLSSDLPRAVESLEALAPQHAAPAERVFREAALPQMPDTPIRLDPQFWAAAARVGWFLGWSGTNESASRARKRARAAGQRLSGLAAEHGSVLLMGHGIFNALIAWELLGNGWRGPIWPNTSYWSSAVYRKRGA